MASPVQTLQPENLEQKSELRQASALRIFFSAHPYVIASRLIPIAVSLALPIYLLVAIPSREQFLAGIGIEVICFVWILMEWLTESDAHAHPER